ncbi:uncharacterized protein [Dysidea avara]|uniref:uncharacterized protein isoform X2 n=1 Tax=Dysidea avara TaxID=196820 RepID=UPI003325D065
MEIQLFIVIICLGEATITAAVIITNGPQDTTVCVNQFASISCGFTGADPNLVVPNWHIMKRTKTGAYKFYRETISVGSDSNIDGLKWIADPLNGNNSVLRVGPVDKADDQSSYQCSFGSVDSSIGVLTVLNIPVITGISVIQTNTAIVISWTSVHAVTYRVSLAGGGVTTSIIFTNNTQYTFHGIIMNKRYRITVIPINWICQGGGMVLAWLPHTVNRTTSTVAVTPTMKGNGHGRRHGKKAAIIITTIGLLILLIMAAIIVLVLVKYRYKLHFGNCKPKHLANQNRRNPDTVTVMSSNYVPISTSNPAVPQQDTYPDCDGVHGD